MFRSTSKWWWATISSVLVSAASAQQPDGDEQAVAGPMVAFGPERAVEFVLSADSLQLGYRGLLSRANGYLSFAALVDDDDDVALSGRITRFGEPVDQQPLRFGVGLGVFGALVDESDEELVALTITGSADYALALEYPLRVGVELSFAPDIATFADGERVVDALVRGEVDLSEWATAFVGYRQLEVEMHDEGDVELDSSLHVGVRLGF